MMRKYLWLIALCLLTLSQSYAQRTIYVSKGGTNNTPFLNWPDAATNIQDAINVATNSDVVQLSNDVYVSTGIYKSNTFLFVTSGISLRGFSALSPTNTVIDGGSPTITNGCIYMNNANARLEHIWVRNGYSTANMTNRSAAGVYMENGTISNCWITGCTDTLYGAGGVVMKNGAISYCIISNNANTRSTTLGQYLPLQAGGVWMSGGQIDNTRIVTNRSVDNAGGIQHLASGGVFSNVEVSFNYTTQRGAGIAINSSITMLYNCKFIGNRAPGGVGGAAYGTIFNCLNCMIVSNLSIRGGGFDLGGTFAATNCLIAANTSTALQGGGIGSGNGCSQYILDSCTIVGNTITGSGGGIWILTGKTNSVFRNCIIYGNSASVAGPDICVGEGDFSLSNTVQYCCISSNLARSVGSITNDPQLVGSIASGGNCRLTPASPCINKGSNMSWMVTFKDLDGNPRVDHLNNKVDIGAYEFFYKGLVLQGR